MLSSTILDVVIGLVFLFLSVSLAAGAAVEALSSLIKLRSFTLKWGMIALLNDKDFNDLAAELYAHALVSPRAPGLSGVKNTLADQTPPVPADQTPPVPADQTPPVPADQTPPKSAVVTTLNAEKSNAARSQLEGNLNKNLPAYVQPAQFAKALTDVLSLLPMDGTAPTIEQLQASVNSRLPAETHPQLNQLLNGIILRAGGNINAIQKELADWFDNAMDRVSGIYKRYTQALVFAVALIISIIVNADTLRVAQRIWAQPSVVADLKVGTTPQQAADLNWQLAKSLPFGWADRGFGYVRDTTGQTVPLAGNALALSALGWLITALASLFGAPFWFDTLQSIVRLKGSGPSPDEKTNRTAAAA